MKQKKKKKQKINNSKFNFDDDYIIGVSKSEPGVKIEKKPSKSKEKKAPTNKKKKKKIDDKKRKVRIRIIKILLVLMLFIGAGCFLCLSPMFNITEIVVKNNESISSETIVSLSEIKLYKNIFQMSKSDAIEKISKNPYIDSVKIKRNLPSTVEITVEVRTEKYLVEFADGKYAVIDGKGYVLRITSDKENLPIITGTTTDVNDIINISDNSVRLCADDLERIDIVGNIIDIAKSYEVDTYISKIDVSDLDDVKLELESEEKTVYLGDCTDLNTRILYMKDIISRESGIKGEIFINGNLSEDKVFFREAVN